MVLMIFVVALNIDLDSTSGGTEYHISTGRSTQRVIEPTSELARNSYHGS